MWFNRDKSLYTWKEYWIDGMGDGFMKLPIMLVAIAFLLFLIAFSQIIPEF